MKDNTFLRNAALEMQSLLLRVINEKETVKGVENYESLRMTLIRGLEAVDIPDFLFSCDSVQSFKIFINALSITEQGKISFIEKTFAPIVNYSTSDKHSVQLPKIATDVINETRYVGRVAKGDDSNLATNKLVKFSWQLISVIAVFATLYGFYLQVKANNFKITVANSSVNHLTIPPRVAGLKANYYYLDSAVIDLWKLDVSLINSGAETIISSGPRKNTMNNDGLSLLINRNFKLLNVEQTNATFPVRVKIKNDTTLIVNFEQWRKSEGLKLGLYVEKTNKLENAIPELGLDERQIVDGKVDNIPYQVIVQSPKLYMIDLLPISIKSPLRWSLIVIFGIIGLVAIPGAAISELKNIKGKGGRFKITLPFLVGFLICLTPLLWLIPKFW